MKPTRIFLDLDDVLNYFTMYALQFVGCLVEKDEFSAYNPDWDFNIVRAANELHPYPTSVFHTETSFWESFPQSFWANVPKSRGCDWFVNKCEELVGRENVYVLTCPTRDPQSLDGKLEWIHNNLPKWIHRQYLIGPPKHLCANPHSILIDDSDKNVNAFREHGGQAFLVPRPWNSSHAQTGQSILATSHFLLRTFRDIGVA